MSFARGHGSMRGRELVPDLDGRPLPGFESMLNVSIKRRAPMMPTPFRLASGTARRGCAGDRRFPGPLSEMRMAKLCGVVAASRMNSARPPPAY